MAVWENEKGKKGYGIYTAECSRGVGSRTHTRMHTRTHRYPRTYSVTMIYICNSAIYDTHTRTMTLTYTRATITMTNDTTPSIWPITYTHTRTQPVTQDMQNCHIWDTQTSTLSVRSHWQLALHHVNRFFERASASRGMAAFGEGNVEIWLVYGTGADMFIYSFGYGLFNVCRS
jgi:hypothetical protein